MSDDKETVAVEHERGNHVALCSGGMESTVATHVSVRWGPADLIVYLDTGTGTEANRRFIERLADEFGVQLWTLRTNENYGEKVRENGFPGPSQHGTMYNSLKERQIGRLATLCSGRGNASDLHLWTGVRKQESRNRMGRVDSEQNGARWTWHAPLADWSDSEVQRYHRRMNLPTNHLWDTLGRSGDCFCGCFGSPEELIDAEAAGCERLVSELRNLEEQADHPDDEKTRWGWGGMTAAEIRAAQAENDDQQMRLCSDCSPDYSALTDGGNDER